MVTVDHRHAEPVVAGALGEREAQHEDADEQRARLGPRFERAAPNLAAGCGRVFADHQKMPDAEGNRDRHQRGDDQQLRCHTDMDGNQE